MLLELQTCAGKISPFNRNLVFMDATSSSVALQELLNNASTLNFNALLVADEQEAQRVIPAVAGV